MRNSVLHRLPVLLAVFAHPDDETFRCGGSLVLLAQKGAQLWVLCATRGEAGVTGLEPEQAGPIRQSELQGACRALGIQLPGFLDYCDGKLSEADSEKAAAPDLGCGAGAPTSGTAHMAA